MTRVPASEPADQLPQSALDRIEELGELCRAASGYRKRQLKLELSDALADDPSVQLKKHAGVQARWHVEIKNLRRAVEWARAEGFEPPRDHRKVRARLSRFLRRLLQREPERVPDSIAELTVGVSVRQAPEVAPG